MSIDDLRNCSREFLSTFMSEDLEAQARLLSECEILQVELTRAVKAHPDATELESLRVSLAMAVETHHRLQKDPEMVRDLAAMMHAPYEPNPRIFDAIDDKDLEAVQAELIVWEINARVGKFESTALYHAMANMCGASLDIINLLLDAGADPKLGLTDCNVLHGIGFGSYEEVDVAALEKVVLRCVEGGADIEQRTRNLQWTPLITAVSEWNAVGTEALLMAGADINVRAGDSARGCFSGADVFAFAEGHAPTTAVLQVYSKAK